MWKIAHLKVKEPHSNSCQSYPRSCTSAKINLQPPRFKVCQSKFFCTSRLPHSTASAHIMKIKTVFHFQAVISLFPLDSNPFTTKLLHYIPSAWWASVSHKAYLFYVCKHQFCLWQDLSFQIAALAEDPTFSRSASSIGNGCWCRCIFQGSDPRNGRSLHKHFFTFLGSLLGRLSSSYTKFLYYLCLWNSLQSSIGMKYWYRSLAGWCRIWIVVSLYSLTHWVSSQGCQYPALFMHDCLFVKWE